MVKIPNDLTKKPATAKPKKQLLSSMPKMVGQTNQMEELPKEEATPISSPSKPVDAPVKPVKTAENASVKVDESGLSAVDKLRLKLAQVKEEDALEDVSAHDDVDDSVEAPVSEELVGVPVDAPQETFKAPSGLYYTGTPGGVMTEETMSYTEPILTDEVIEKAQSEDVSELGETIEVDVPTELVGDPELKALHEAKEEAAREHVVPETGVTDSVDKKPMSKKTKIGLVCAGVLAIILLGAGTAAIIGGDSKDSGSDVKTEKTTKSSSSKAKSAVASVAKEAKKEKELSYTDKLKASLEEKAKDSGIKDYDIALNDIGGGYLLGATTYYPDDDAKRYTDYSLHKPENKAEVSTEETATKMEDALKATLPVINETIEVKDASKVTMETYKVDDSNFVTVLMYGKKAKPFAYVTSDNDLNMVNHVTTYYVSDVAK